MEKKTLRDLTKEQKEILFNTSYSPELAGILIHMQPSDIEAIRYRSKFRDNINRASKNYRARIREKEMKKFKKPYGMRMPWTKEEEKLVMDMFAQGHSDIEIANKLNRSVYSISKKREILKKGNIFYEK